MPPSKSQQRPSKTCNSELNKQVIIISDTRDLRAFISCRVESCQCGHFLSQNTTSFTGRTEGIRAARTGNQDVDKIPHIMANKR